MEESYIASRFFRIRQNDLSFNSCLQNLYAFKTCNCCSCDRSPSRTTIGPRCTYGDYFHDHTLSHLISCIFRILTVAHCSHLFGLKSITFYYFSFKTLKKVPVGTSLMCSEWFLCRIQNSYNHNFRKSRREKQVFFPIQQCFVKLMLQIFRRNLHVRVSCIALRSFIMQRCHLT